MSVGSVDKDSIGTRAGRKLAVVDRDLCVACGCCARECPVGAVSVYRGLYACVDEGRCVGCGRCASACPAEVIEIRRREAEA